MSRLIDKLNQVSKAAPQPMGFRAAYPVSPKPQMLLIASFTQIENADMMANHAASADAILLPISKLSSGAKALQERVQSLPDIPWGGFLQEVGEKGIGAMAKAGCDFVVFPAASAVFAIDQDDKMGKILQVAPSLSESSLKAVNNLPMDAVLTTAEHAREHSLTWHDLMLFQHFANLLTPPLLVSMPSNVTASELKALWEAGVDGVVIEVSTAQTAKRLEELRQAIGEPDFLPPRKRGKAAALLPSIGRETESVTDTEEEEEEE